MTTELLGWLIDAAFATSIAAIAVLFLRKPLQRWLGAEIAYRLWIVVPLAAIAAIFSLPHGAQESGGVDAQAIAASTPTVVVSVTRNLGAIDADRWLLVIWLIGAGALLAVLVWQQRRFVTRLQLHEKRDGSWRSGVANVVPAVLGVLRQKLVLPEGFETDYSDEEQHLVIAHERMHQSRHDPWALAVCAVMRTLFWFNPLVHTAAIRFRRDIELACDAAVLRTHPGSRRRYATALLKTHIATSAIPVGCQWHQTPPMKERIMLLKHALPARRARLAGAIILSIAALGTAGIALAGHESALSTASALAASVPIASGHDGSFYQVKLQVQARAPVSGIGDARTAKMQSMAETVVVRAGETATMKADGHGHGPAWGLRFHVDPSPRFHAMMLTGEVFTPDEQHVVAYAKLIESTGTPFVIAAKDKAGNNYRIDAQVAAVPPPPAPPAPPSPPSIAEMPAPPAPPAPPALAGVPPPPPPMSAPALAQSPAPPAPPAPAPPPPTRARHARYAFAVTPAIPPAPPAPALAPMAPIPGIPSAPALASTAPPAPVAPTPPSAPVTPAPPSAPATPTPPSAPAAPTLPPDR